MQVGSLVKIKQMSENEFPVAHTCAGHVGMIECAMEDSEGDTAFLVWFGYTIPRLHNDGAWFYPEHLENAPLMEEV
jgi:hypothetical protein